MTTVFTFWYRPRMHWDTYQSMSCKISSYLPFHFFIFAVRLFRLNTKKYLDVWGGWDGNSLVLMTIFIVYFLRFDKKLHRVLLPMVHKYCSTEIKQISNIINVTQFPFCFLHCTNMYFSHWCEVQFKFWENKKYPQTEFLV